MQVVSSSRWLVACTVTAAAGMLPLLAIAVLEQLHGPRTVPETKPAEGQNPKPQNPHTNHPSAVAAKPTRAEPALERHGRSDCLSPAWRMGKAADDRLAAVLRAKIRPLVSAALILAMLAVAAATVAFFGVHIGSRPRVACTLCHLYIAA